MEVFSSTWHAKRIFLEIGKETVLFFSLLYGSFYKYKLKKKRLSFSLKKKSINLGRMACECFFPIGLGSNQLKRINEV